MCFDQLVLYVCSHNREIGTLNTKGIHSMRKGLEDKHSVVSSIGEKMCM